jgi:hypothetical protein
MRSLRLLPHYLHVLIEAGLSGHKYSIKSAEVLLLGSRPPSIEHNHQLFVR